MLAIERTCRDVMAGAIAAPVVEVAALRSAGAAIGYLGLHHRKPQQAPPAGWRGMVERHSRGYFTQPIAELRAQARAELAAEWIAKRDGITLAEAALEVQLQRQRLAEHRTRLIRVRQRSGSPLIDPGRELAA